MRILITGGTGFVGLSLTEHLLALGHEVRLLAPDGSDDLLQDPALAGAMLHRCDIRDADALVSALDEVDGVVHLAAITPDADHEVADPARIVDVNVVGTATLMHAVARHVPDARVLVVSSVAVYGTGNPLGAAWNEARDKAAPSGLYGITKQAAEQVADFLARTYGTDLRIARLGPVYGPWEHDSGVRPLLSPQTQALALALSGQEIVLPRTLVADWLYSRDAGRALAALLLAERPADPLINLGAGRVFCVAEWCRTAAAHLSALRWRLAAPGETANVHLTLRRDRAPLAVDRLRELVPEPLSRSLADCVTDHLAWAQTHSAALPRNRRDP